jgi:hypothetical protein
MPHKRRIDTLRVVVSGAPSLSSSPKRNLIVGEINRIIPVSRLSRQNGWLLTVLHTTRALDTILSEIIAAKRWPVGQNKNLRGYLLILYGQGVITNAEKDQYHKEIVKKRNAYMHEAGAMPNQLEADKIYNEMHACIAVITARVR